MNDPLITLVGRLVAVAVGDPVFAPEGDHTITATVEGSGSVSATALWQGSNDKLGWTTLATLSPAGTATGTAKASTTETYRYWRLNVTALTGYAVTGTVASETSSGGSSSSVSGDGTVTVNARDGQGRVTSYTDATGTYTVTYGSFGPATVSGNGKITTYNYSAAGVLLSVTTA